MLYGTKRLAEADKRGGVEPRFMQGALPSSPRCEVRVHRGEPLLLLWYAHTDGEAVRAINRVEVDDDRIARLQNYFFTPDFIAEVCGELGVPFRSNGYRWFLPAANS
jgi:RNA polymerase sigma-70 factor (ECF subfamily)